MPVEGTENLSTTSDATDTNTATNQNTDTTNTQKGTEVAGTQTASSNTEAQEKTLTLTQDQLDKIVQNRIKSGVKAELKKLTGDDKGGVTLESLQTDLQNLRTENQMLQAQNAVRDYANDASNQLNIPPANIAAVLELVQPRLEYQDGKPTNLKEAFAAVKGIAPALFAIQPTNIDAGVGRTVQTGPVNMNDFIRNQAKQKNSIAA